MTPPPASDTWVPITLQGDVANSINSAEMTTLISMVGNVDPDSTIIPDTIAEARGYCRARVTLGPPNTVPQEIKLKVIDLIIYRLAKRFGSAPLAEKYKAAAEAATALLEKVSSGAFKVSEPMIPTSDVTSAPAPSFHQHDHDRPRHFGWDAERGI